MTAVADEVDAKNSAQDHLIAFARRMLPRFSIEPIDRNNPIVLILLNRYRRLFGMQPGPVAGIGWKAMTFDGKVVMVYCEQWQGKIVLTENVCPANSRYGRLAVYALLVFYRLGYERGEIAGFITTVLATNTQMSRAIARVFQGLGPIDEQGLPVPRSMVYQLGVS